MRGLVFGGLTVLGMVGCTPTSDPSDGSDSNSLELRRTDYFLEGINESGEYVLQDGRYTYAPDDHLFFRSYEGVTQVDDTQMVEAVTMTLDRNGFPTRVVSTLDGELEEARTYVFSTSLFQANRIDTYADIPTSTSSPTQSATYRYDLQGRVTVAEILTYYEDSNQPESKVTRRYFGQKSLLPGTSYRYFANTEYFSEAGVRTRATKHEFGSEGYPTAYLEDETGNGDFRTLYEIDVETNAAGQIVRLDSLATDEDDQYEFRYEYNENGLLDTETITRPVAVEADRFSEDAIGAPEEYELQTTRSELTWHRNPVGGIRGGTYTVYKTVDGEVDGWWSELTWTEESYDRQYFDETGAPQVFLRMNQETVSLP